MLRNRRGATSLRWLRALLDHDIEVHGQVVVCPGVNDGDVLDDTLAGVLDEYPELASVCGGAARGQRVTTESRDASPHAGRGRRGRRRGRGLAGGVPRGARSSPGVRGRRVLPAGRTTIPRPPRPTRASRCTRTASAWPAPSSRVRGRGRRGRPDHAAGFFAWVDGAPAEGYRAPRSVTAALRRAGRSVALMPRRGAPIGILTGTYGARVLGPLVDRARTATTSGSIAVDNRVLRRQHRGDRADGRRGPRSRAAAEPAGHRYLLPDVCLIERPVPRRT